MQNAREIIIDVGSASVGAAVVSVSPKTKNPLLANVSRVAIGAEEGKPANITERTLAALKTLFEKLHTTKTSSVRIVLASPWYESRARTIASEAKSPVRISASRVAAAVKSYREKEGASFPAAGRVRLESTVTQAYVNGYQTALLAPVTGTTLRIELYESAADKAFVDALTGVVHSAFPHAYVSFHSFPLIAFVVLRATREEETFAFIDVGGEVTDVAIVHQDGLRFLGSFPRGARTFMSDVEKKSSGAPGARLSLYARGELSNEEKTAFAPAFDAGASLWNADLQKVLDAAIAETPIPRSAFVLADPEELSWFGKVLEAGRETFPARIIPVTQNFFQTAVDLGEGGVYDAFLTMEALFFHTSGRELIEARP